MVREGALWRLPEHQPRPTNADEKLWQRVRPLLAATELRPPRVREIAEKLALGPQPVDRFLRGPHALGAWPKSPTTDFFCRKP